MAEAPVIERVDGRFCVRGAVTLASVQALLDQGKQTFAGSDLRIDLSGVTEADSSAIALMLDWSREAAARGARICFENLSENLRTLMSLYDVGEFLPACA
jgi:phospholipid transport system transporter-binding protein